MRAVRSVTSTQPQTQAVMNLSRGCVFDIAKGSLRFRNLERQKDLTGVL
jgi:hypothetical protein